MTEMRTEPVTKVMKLRACMVNGQATICDEDGKHLPALGAVIRLEPWKSPTAEVVVHLDHIDLDIDAELLGALAPKPEG